MTAQLHDSILLQDRKFSVVDVNGGVLFHPADFNMHPFQRITSCWRGFVCGYKISADRLFLDTLQVNLDQRGPAIQNVEPSFSAAGTFNNNYNKLNLPIDFSGQILAADQFIQELYVHMGFHPAWKYETVYELVVSHGRVLETRNVSREMAQLRKQMTHEPPRSPE